MATLLLESYLLISKKDHFLNFGLYESDWEGIKVGVPQGSVWRPVLFLVNIIDLQNNTSLKVLNLADNTLLYTTFKKDDYKTDTAYLNSELDNVSNWFKDIRFKIDTDKQDVCYFVQIK